MSHIELANPPITENKFFAYSLLLSAIVFEVVATGFLTASKQFTRLWPSIFTIFSYGLSYYLFSWSIIAVPVGLAYGIWSALGVVLIMFMGMLIWHQVPDIPAIIGSGLIIAGVITANCFSKMDA